MIRSFFFNLLVLPVIALVIWVSFLWPQSGQFRSPKGKALIEGVWTQICYENEGDIDLMLPGPIALNSSVLSPPYIWRISKENIDKGPNNQIFPTERFISRFLPGNKLDMVPTDAKGKKLPKAGKLLAYYHLKDDYLFICWSYLGDPRPESFTTSVNTKTRMLVVLRRGIIK